MSSSFDLQVSSRETAVITATTGQTAIAITFPFQSVAELVIYKEAVDGTRTVLTAPSGFTATGAGSSAGGTATLVTPAAAGEKYRVAGAATIERRSDMTVAGRYNTAALEGDLDKGVIIDAELKRDLGRTVRAHPMDPALAPLPAKTARLGKRAVFDGVSGDLAAADEYVAATDAVAGLMSAADKAKLDGITGPAGYVTAFGAAGDGVTDDTAAVQAAFDAGNKHVFFPAGTYLISGGIVVPSGVDVSGAGDASVIKTGATLSATSGVQAMIVAQSGSRISIRDLAFDASAMTTFSGGMRCVWFDASTCYSVKGCYFKTPGAAVASIGCAQFQITGNRVEISSLDGVAKHDGIIDQWGGCTDFTVSGNIIKAGGVGRFPIIVTGEATDGSPTANARFTISGNIVHSAKIVGIWLNGRDGGNTLFTVSDNVVDTVADYFGIALADSDYGTVSGNTIKNAARNGIRVYLEGGKGGDGGDDLVISGNNIIGANTSANASDLEGAAIAIDTGCSGNLISGNRVSGSTHRNAVFFASGSSGNRECGGLYSGGVSSAHVADPALTNLVSSGLYVPTLTSVANIASSSPFQCHYIVNGDVVTVSLKVTITPTAAASTTTQLGVSLPIASNLAATEDATGTLVSQFNVVAAVLADATNDRVTVQFASTNTSANVLYGQFSYRIK